MHDWLQVGLGAAFVGAGTRLLYRNRRRNPLLRPKIELAVVSAGELPVLNCAEIIERTGAAQLVDALRVKLGVPPEVFAEAVQPVIERVGEFVQLMPATECGHPAEPGGLFIHALEVAALALDFRRGQILPRGAAPEVIAEQGPRWTYAVFIAGLLNGIAASMADLRVQMRGIDGTLKMRGIDGTLKPWSPLTGSLSECKAISDRVEFPARGACDDEVCGQLPVLLLNRMVPAPILDWLAADPALMRELLACLAPDHAKPSVQAGVILELVRRAESEAVRRRLLHGERLLQAPPLVTSSCMPEPIDPVSPEEEVSNVLTTALVGVAKSNPSDSADTPTGATVAVVDANDAPALEFLEDAEERRRSRVSTPSVGGESASQLREDGDKVPDAALRFMGWLQQGLAEGSIQCNEAGAWVHFVEEGMLLVSPRIFREFARRFGEDGMSDADHAKAVQRQVLRAGWHLTAGQGVNFLTYQMGLGGRAVSQLSGVVILRPERFVNPVPPANSLLVRLPGKVRTA